jgi:hypothetical protein
MNSANFKPLHFFDEPIEVIFDQPPALEKKPPCPDGFIWQSVTYRIVEPFAEWHDYRRKGRMASNMRPVHAEAATQKGSWGVGRFYFRVRVESGQIFELYYDRAPKGSKQRKGAWFLHSEMQLLDAD